MNHTWTSDLDIVLQSPSGQNVILLSDHGGSNNLSNTTITFSNAAATTVPNVLNIPSGTYRPTNTAGPDTWPAPGPGPITQINPNLATFTGDMNGTWRLFTNDQVGGDLGNINGGYEINFQIPPSPPPVGWTFLWAPAAGLSSTTTNPVAASPSSTRTYTVIGTAPGGCQTSAAITIQVYQLPAVTSQPSNVTACAGTSVTFTVGGTGQGITYQWQVSTNGGGTYTNLANGTPYSGVNTATLTVNPVSAAMTGYRYRCVISGTCPPAANSVGAILTVNALPVVTIAQTTPTCGGVAGINGTALTASGATTYVWTPNGTGSGLYTNTTATTVYTGTNLATVYAAPTTNTIYTVTGTDGTTGCSNTATVGVVFTPPPPIITPASVTMCLGDPAVKLKSSSQVASSVQFCSGAISVPIPEGNFPNPPAGAATSNITASGIPANAVITAIGATINIDHPYVGDVIIVLRSPNGQIYNLDALLNATNNAGANFTNTKIMSNGVTRLNNGTAPWTGTFRADAVGATFVAFGFTLQGGPTGYAPTTQTIGPLAPTGAAANGQWTIAMYDAGAPDLGTLTSWCLNIEYYVGAVVNPTIWTPAAGLFSDANATVPYVAGTPVDSVWVRPTPSGVYNYQATVSSSGFDAFQTFSNPAPITIPSSGTGTPYPSNIVVSGLPGSGVSVESVVLRGLSHTWSNDIDVLLQSPTGQNVILMSDVGGTGGINNATYTFRDNGAAMATGAANGTGTYRPTNFADGSGGDTWPTPGPGAFTQANPALALFGNTANANGTWRLMVVDDVGGDQGQIANGWSIEFKYPTPGCTSAPRNVTVTVNQPTTITTQPVSQTVCTDKVATFTVAAGGSGPFAYRWQVSTDVGNTWANISNGGVYAGATSATLVITAPPVSMSGYFYRCVVTGAAPCASVTSFQVILTVNPLPTIVISAAPYTRLFPGLTTTLTSTVSPAAAQTYTWLRNGVAVSGANTGILNVDVDGMGLYTLRVTDVNGCTNTSNSVAILDSASGKCFIYPNPTSGQFQVRYYSVANNVLPRSVTVYNANGDRVLTQFYTIGRPYDRMDVDLRKSGKGLYWVEVGDMNGNRLTMCRVVVQ